MWIRKKDLTKEQKKRIKERKEINFDHKISEPLKILISIGVVVNGYLIYRFGFDVLFYEIIILAAIAYYLNPNSPTSSQICLHCEKHIGGSSDDGHGFKVYGKKKAKWHQFTACDTPDKCDFEYMHKLQWYEDKEE